MGHPKFVWATRPAVEGAVGLFIQMRSSVLRARETIVPSKLKPKFMMVVAIVAWLIFVAAWLSVLGHLFRHWGGLRGELHYDLVGLLLFFGVLWGQLVRSRDNTYDLLFTAFAFVMVADVVHKVP
jgi:hypothetical protein